jgi:hypothetical protein
MALMTISAAGFGRRISWEDDETPPGHKISFKRSVEILNSRLLLKMLCPKWIFEWAPTKKIREARDGFAEFRVRPKLGPRPSALRSRINPMYAVISGRDDQRAKVLQR